MSNSGHLYYTPELLDSHDLVAISIEVDFVGIPDLPKYMTVLS